MTSALPNVILSPSIEREKYQALPARERAFFTNLQTALKQEGISAWIAGEELESTAESNVIATAAAHVCPVLISVLSAQMLKVERYIDGELQIFTENNHGLPRLVIFALLEDCAIPATGDQMAALSFDFRNWHGGDIHRDDPRFRRMVVEIKRCLQDQPDYRMPAEVPLATKDAYRAVAYSPDEAGKYLVARTDKGAVDVWNTRWRAYLYRLERPNPATSVAFHSSDALLAAEGRQLWHVNLASGKVVELKAEFKEPIRLVTASPNGQSWAVALQNNTVVVQGPRGTLTLNHSHIVNDASFSVDGTALALAFKNRRVWVYDLLGGERIPLDDSGADWIKTVQFSRTLTRHLIAASSNPRSVIWDVRTGRSEALLLDSPARYACFSPDDQQVLAASERYAYLYPLHVDPKTGQPRVNRGREVSRAFDNLFCAQFSPDGKQVAVASLAGLRLWNITAG